MTRFCVLLVPFLAGCSQAEYRFCVVALHSSTTAEADELQPRILTAVSECGGHVLQILPRSQEGAQVIDACFVVVPFSLPADSLATAIEAHGLRTSIGSVNPRDSTEPTVQVMVVETSAIPISDRTLAELQASDQATFDAWLEPRLPKNNAGLQ